MWKQWKQWETLFSWGPKSMAMVFSVVTYDCESWTIKKAEGRKIDAFKLWCWRRLLRVPWTARSSQSILKEINPEYSLEGLMLKLKLQYFGHLMWTADSFEETLMLGKIEGKRRRGWQRMKMVRWHHWCNGHELRQTPGDEEEQGGLAYCNLWSQSIMSWRVRHDWQLNDKNISVNIHGNRRKDNIISLDIFFYLQKVYILQNTIKTHK